MKNSAKRVLTALLCLCLCLSFCVFSPGKASAEQEIIKVLARTNYTPVALMDVLNVTAETTTTGVFLDSYRWVDTTLGTVVTDAFDTGTYRVEITLGTYDGYVFADSVATYLNNIPADYTISADHRHLTLTRSYVAEIWAPTVIKNPGNERVDEGGLASFAATALYTLDYAWHAVDPATNTDYPVEVLPDVNGVRLIDDVNRSTLNLYNVPASMDGWQIYCTFLGASWAKTNSARATLRVNHTEPALSPVLNPAQGQTADPAAETDPDAAAAPDASLDPAADPAAEASPEPTPIPTPEPTPEPHEHSFSAGWVYDDNSHWHECDCGERADEAAHDMTWSTEKIATRKEAGLENGVCPVCGFTTERETELTALGVAVSYAPFAIGALVILALLIVLLRRRKKAPPPVEGYSGRHVK